MDIGDSIDGVSDERAMVDNPDCVGEDVEVGRKDEEYVTITGNKPELSKEVDV